MVGEKIADDEEELPFLGRKITSTERRAKEPVRVPFRDGYMLLKRPTGEDYREYKRLLRNEDGSMNIDRYDLNEELWLQILLVDPDGNQLYSVDDVFRDHVFDAMDLPDLQRLKAVADKLIGSRVSDEELGND